MRNMVRISQKAIAALISLVCLTAFMPTVAAAGDTTPPELVSMKFNKTNFLVGETVVITLKIKEEESGVDCSNSSVNFNSVSICSLNPTDVPDTYTATWKIDKSIKTGTYNLQNIVLRNNNWVESVYSVEDGTLTPTSIHITNNEKTDFDPPKLVKDSFKVNRTSANVGDIIKFELKATDESLIKNVGISYNISTRVFGQIDFIPDKSRQGYFTAEYTVPETFVDGYLTITTIFLYDIWGNGGFVTLPNVVKIRINNPDLLPTINSVKINQIEVETKRVKQGDVLTITANLKTNGNKLIIFEAIYACSLWSSTHVGPCVRLKETSPGVFTGSTIIAPGSTTGPYYISEIEIESLNAINGTEVVWPNDSYKDTLSTLKFNVGPVFSGTENISIPIGSSFDPLEGVKAANNTEGDMTGKIKATSAVDTSKPGMYLVKYKIPSVTKDEYGNTQYYYDFRWIGVTEVMPGTTGTAVSITDGAAVIGATSSDATLYKNGVRTTFANTVSSPAEYTVSLKPGAIKSVAKGSKTSAKVVIDKSPPKIAVQSYINSKYISVSANITDASGVATRKWMSGEKTVQDFAKGGAIFKNAFGVGSFGKYTVYAKDKLGHQTVKVIDIKPLGAVTSLKAATASYTSVRLTWAKVSGVNGYAVYRATSLDGTYKKIKTLAGTSYTNTGLTTGKTYYYKVRAYRTNGSATTFGVYSSRKYAKPVPAAPAGLKAVHAASGSIRVTWNAVGGATRYMVYRAASKTGKYSLVTTTTSRRFTNSGLQAGRYYFYKVRAYHMEGKTKVYGNVSPYAYAKA